MTTRADARLAYIEAEAELLQYYPNSGLDNALYEAVAEYTERLPLENLELTLEQYYAELVRFVEETGQDLANEAEQIAEADHNNQQQ